MLGFLMAVLALAPLAVGEAIAQPAPAGAPSQLPPIDPIAKPVFKGEFPLYPSHIVRGPDEQWESYLGGSIVRNVINPTLTPLLPEPAKRNGTAVIYAPGGGFLYLGMNDAEPARLVARGVSVFILKYRTNPTDRDPRTFLTNMYRFLFDMAAKNRAPGASEAPALHAPARALEDGLTAVRLIRSRAKEWGIDQKRIGFMGGPRAR
jgi:acetyl esterase/lipase